VALYLNFWQIDCPVSDCPSFGDRSWPVQLIIVLLFGMLAYVLIRGIRISVRSFWLVREARMLIRSVKEVPGGDLNGLIAVTRSKSQGAVARALSEGLVAFADAPAYFTCTAAIETADRAFRRNQKNLILKLVCGLATLESIAATAPFLALVGTCFGIFDAFGGIVMERGWAQRVLMLEVTGALNTTLAGLFVATSATWCCAWFRKRVAVDDEISSLGSRTVAYLGALPRSEIRAETPALTAIGSNGSLKGGRKFPVAKKISRLPFAIVAVPVLGVVVAASAILHQGETSVGIDVHLKGKQSLTRPITVRITHGANGSVLAQIDRRKLTLAKLSEILQTELKQPAERTTDLRGEDDLTWQEVVAVIDALRIDGAVVVLLPKEPRQARTRHPR
jgi:biopolymer transport protein ExbB/TolQ/biopolymer transport protein ExbD